MIYMLCRNRVEDFGVWKTVFDSQEKEQREAGLRLVNLWRCVEDPNNVFFVLKVADVDKARSFVSTPKAAETGKTAGVIEGEFHFVNSVHG